ncbi:hypothetical protein D3C87_2173990 [compost metagenome]
MSVFLLSAELPHPARVAPAKEKAASPVITFDIFFVILKPLQYIYLINTVKPSCDQSSAAVFRVIS